MAVISFIDVKKTSNYISQAELVQQIRDLGIDNDFISQIKSFLTDKLVKLVIDRFINSRQKVKLGISSVLPVSLILFLIYINEVFFLIKKQLTHVICISFIDNLNFFIANWSISKIVKTLQKLRWIAPK